MPPLLCWKWSIVAGPPSGSDTGVVTRVTLVRHGETAWNANGRWQGHAHVPLNELGRLQARSLAEHIKSAGARFRSVVTSDSTRARETAQLLSEALNIPLELDVRLREIDIGEWQGLTADEVRSWDAERYLAVEHDPWLVPRPGGESGAEVGARAMACLESRAHHAPGEHLLAVSHGGTIRNLLQHLGLARADRVVVGNTSCSVLARDQRGDGQPRWTLESVNALGHLGTAGARVEVEP